MPPLRIFVVDDHDVVRMGLRTLCASHPDWLICGEASAGEEAICTLEEYAPDLVILDVSLRGVMNGFDVAREIRTSAPKVKIIIYSLHEIPFGARKAGADTFVAKSSGVAALRAAIERLIQPQA